MDSSQETKTLKRKERNCSTVKRVMVVEDFEDILGIVQSILEKSGYEVLPVRDGSHAIIEFLESFRCCSHVGILMDLALPDINGLRVMSAIREIEKGSAYDCTPVRFGVHTANLELVEGTEPFESLNVTLRIQKPMDPALLAEKVEKWLCEPAPQLYVVKKAVLGVSL